MKKPTRSVTRSVRTSPLNDFLIDVAARIQRRTMSSFIENAAAETALSVKLHDGRTIREVIDKVWHVDRDERLRRLYALDKSLLTYDEECYLIAKGESDVSQ